ncbi:hypothetical protein JCM5350_001934 [Sporobolomyces pararoseus]
MSEETRKRSLPDELLLKIFSSSKISQHQLGVFCSVSKRFLAIVKPLLYRSILLGNHEHVEKLRNYGRMEDLKLIQSVRIVGNGDSRERLWMRYVDKAFMKMDQIEKLLSEAGVMKRLIEGEIVEPSQLRLISLYRIVEDPAVLLSAEFSINPRIFENLVDLSIVSYRGGSNVVSKLLSRQVLPSLERLALCDMTEMTASSSESEFTRRTGRAPGRRIFDGPLERYLVDCDLFLGDKIKLLVSRRFEFLNDLPSLVHLAVIQNGIEVDESTRYAVAFSYSATHTTSLYYDLRIFFDLEFVAENFDTFSLRYLSLPSHYSSDLPLRMQATLDNLIDLGVAVHFDANLGRSIAPPSFFDFRRKEEEMEARMARMSFEEY